MSEIEKSNFIVEYGSFGTIYKVLYKERLYAYKNYYSDIYNDFFNISMIDKMNSLSKIKSYFNVMPNFLVIDDNNNPITYLAKWIDGYSLENIIDAMDMIKKVELLKSLKNNLLLLHNLGIIHGDIHSGNVMIDKNYDKTFIIDFDNCQYQNYELNFEYANVSAKNFIKKYGVRKELDIYMFNRMTYELLKEINDTEINNYINKYEEDFFDMNSCFGKICETMLLNSNEPSNAFLIDNLKIKKL